MDFEREALTVKETAAVLGVGTNAVYSAIRSGTIPAVRLRGRFLVPRRRLDAFLAADGCGSTKSTEELGQQEA